MKKGLMVVLAIVVFIAFFLIFQNIFEKRINQSPENLTENEITENEISDLGLMLPVNEEDVIFDKYGIWPFGVRGGDHPEGHPGIDFELEERDPVFAVANGEIKDVGDSGHYGFTTATLTINESLSVYYTGSLDFIVSKNQEVKAGDTIAYAVMSEEVGEASFHFETFNTKTSLSECPVEHLSDDSKEILERIFQNATYSQKEEFLLL